MARLSMSEQLHDIQLDGGGAEQDHGHHRRSTRPGSVSGPMHEVLLILVAALVGASFLLLQRAILVINDTVRHSLRLDMSDVAWMSSSSGYMLATFDRC